MNKKVNQYNVRNLQALESPITLQQALHCPPAAKRFQSEDFRGLERLFYLAVDAKISLTTNIQPATGLLNNTRGKIVDIVHLPGSAPNMDLANFIVVHFPTYTGAQFFVDESLTNCILFGPIEFGTDDFRHHRTQYPFRLAYASTVYRAQGETLDQSVVDLGDKEAVPELSFVGLSRVCHVSNLAVYEFSFDRLKKSWCFTERATKRRCQTAAVDHQNF